MHICCEPLNHEKLFKLPTFKYINTLDDSACIQAATSMKTLLSKLFDFTPQLG